MRRGLLYTERDAQGLGYFAKGNVVDVWNQRSSFYYDKRVANVFVGMWSGGGRQYVQVVWKGVLAREAMLQVRLAIAGTRFPCFTLEG